MRTLSVLPLMLLLSACGDKDAPDSDWFDDQDDGLLDDLGDDGDGDGEPDDDKEPPDDDPDDDDPDDDDPPDDEDPDEDPDDTPAAGLLEEGVYHGGLELSWEESAMGEEGVCTGVMEVIVDNSSSWPLHGEALCTFEGGDFLDNDQLWVALKGKDLDEGDLYGEITYTFDGVLIRSEWKGTGGEGVIQVELGGDGIFASDTVDTDVSWLGGFRAEL